MSRVGHCIDRAVNLMLFVDRDAKKKKKKKKRVETDKPKNQWQVECAVVFSLRLSAHTERQR